jgi:hypothetical protein
MMEVGLVFDRSGNAIYWHLPRNRSATLLPDSRILWEVLWQHRALVGGFAHTHPWRGRAQPSSIDLTTFAAIELGLGKRLLWPIVTLDDVTYHAWDGSDEREVVGARRGEVASVETELYTRTKPMHALDDATIERLRELSR